MKARSIMVVLGTALVLLLPQPSQAHHRWTLCSNDPSGMDEVYAEWNNVVFVGVDLGLGNPVGAEPRAVCVADARTTTYVFVGQEDPAPGTPGRRAWVSLCTVSGGTETCQGLGSTGAEVNTAAPLFSCAWVNGTQQSPGCP